MAFSPVYTKVLARVSGLVGGRTFTVPTGKVWIATDLDVYVGAKTPPVVARFEDSATGGTIWYDIAAPDTSAYMSWRGRQAFVEGESFALASENGPLDARVTGYELDAVASP